MNEQKSTTLNNNTKITLGLAIALFIGAFGFFMRMESRITTLETLIETHVNAPQIHYEGFRSMEDKFMPRKEAERQFEQISKVLERIEKKLN